MKTIDALKEIAWQVSIEEFMDDENEQELINRMRGYINAGHVELGLDPVVIKCAEDATDEQIITAINEYLKEMDE
jgi:fatty acid/phospholipid biosynthesis enzyme